MSDHESSHHHHEGEDIGFEREDLSARGVFAFLIALGLIAVLIHFALRGMSGYLDAREKHSLPPPHPLMQKPPADARVITPDDIQRFPQPRLETDERTEINGFRTREEQILNSYGWVDENAGVMHIPIDRAMQLLAERGLPTREQNSNA